MTGKDPASCTKAGSIQLASFDNDRAYSALFLASLNHIHSFQFYPINNICAFSKRYEYKYKHTPLQYLAWKVHFTERLVINTIILLLKRQLIDLNNTNCVDSPYWRWLPILKFALFCADTRSRHGKFQKTGRRGIRNKQSNDFAYQNNKAFYSKGEREFD